MGVLYLIVKKYVPRNNRNSNLKAKKASCFCGLLPCLQTVSPDKMADKANAKNPMTSLSFYFGHGNRFSSS